MIPGIRSSGRCCSLAFTLSFRAIHFLKAMHAPYLMLSTRRNWRGIKVARLRTLAKNILLASAALAFASTALAQGTVVFSNKGGTSTTAAPGATYAPVYGLSPDGSRI